MSESTRYDTKEADRYRQAMIRCLAQEFDISPEKVLTHTFDDRKSQARAWLYETLAWACARILDNEPKLAFRALLQANEYRGTVGGFWPGPVVSDCALFLRNELEKTWAD